MDRRFALALGVAVLVVVSSARAETPALPPPKGFVTDSAAALRAETRTKLEHLLTELQQKTGAEIAVVVVDTTEPLTDFDYAMQVAETWKPGRKGEDTGAVVLLALKDRKLRILTGYGLEEILPDGLVGEIQDREMVPALRAGNVEAAVWGGVSELARRIAASRGVQLTGLPERGAPARQELPPWAVLTLLLLGIILMMWLGPRMGFRGGPQVFFPGGRGGGFPGGFGGGNGGFGGFGGGGFGGGGAGRSW